MADEERERREEVKAKKVRSGGICRPPARRSSSLGSVAISAVWKTRIRAGRMGLSVGSSPQTSLALKGDAELFYNKSLVYQTAHPLSNNPSVCVTGYENSIDPNPFILFAKAALFLGMRVRLLQSRLDVLASCHYWVLRGIFL